MTINIQVNQENVRLDKFLTQELEDYSRATIQTWLTKDLITVNGKQEKASYKVQMGDQIIIAADNEEEEIEELAHLEAVDMNLDVVYEDDDILVINKPKGLVVHPSKGHQQDTLVNGLLFHAKELSDGTGAYRPGIVHRLDKDTSGLMVVAKNNQAHQKLADQLLDHSMERTYVALVYGLLEHQTGTIKVPIGRDPKNRLKFAADRDGKEAITHFKLLELGHDTSLVELQLETGRTHQIRVHMDYIGHPVVDDELYGNRQSYLGHGQLLHAKRIGFIHPTTGEEMNFDSDLPQDFEDIKEFVY